jgi:hypothetical protein
MFGSRRRRLGATIAAIVGALVIAQAGLAYTETGHVWKLNHAGVFHWCDPDVCTYWYSYSSGYTDWTTTQQHSEGQTYYVVAPFQQAELLTDGKDLWADAVYPTVSYWSKITYASGTVLYSSYHVPSGTCYAGAYSSTDLYWSGCSTTGFALSTATYPPGSTESHYVITATAVTGTFGDVYSGSLR